MKATKHSLLPWYSDRLPSVYSPTGVSLAIFSPNGDTICRMLGHADLPDAVADAEFLVRAVNSHDELVARLEQALRYLDHPEVHAIPFALPVSVCIDHCRVALDNAKKVGAK